MSQTRRKGKNEEAREKDSEGESEKCVYNGHFWPQEI